MTSNMLFIFHSDAGSEAGMGHMQECLSVAEVLIKSNVEIAFIVPQESRQAQEEVTSRGHRVYPISEKDWQEGKAQQIEGIVKKRSAFVVSNLVACKPSYAELVGSVAKGWATITEHREEELAPVNFNISLSPELVPLSQVWTTAKNVNVRETVSRILINFGGSDPRNITALSLELLRQGLVGGNIYQEFSVDVVLGPLFEHSQMIGELAETYPRQVNVCGPLDQGELCKLALAADLAITAGGGTMYEFCSIGLPCIVLPVLDKNRLNADVLASRGAVLLTERVDHLTAARFVSSLGSLLVKQRRQQYSRNARRAVDGLGSQRIATELMEQWKKQINHG